MRKILILAVVIVAGYALLQYGQVSLPGTSDTSITDSLPIDNAFGYRQSNIQVNGKGTVIRILPDDNDGSRHQRFIVELSSGRTILISHNIDLAPRINTLKEGDKVSFFGEYEWNPQGGVVHWTHKDPAGRHDDGWIKHEGTRYE